MNSDSHALPYLDVLTAADLIVKARLKFQSRTTAEASDYDIAFASICVFVPNKPRTAVLKDNSSRVRRAIEGIYISDKKRAEFAQAVQPVVLKGNKDDLFVTLAGIKEFSEFDNRVLNVQTLTTR